MDRAAGTLQHFAMSLHLGQRENHYFMIGTAYFDASGEKESPVVVVAGFLAPTVSWIEFEKEWKACLNKDSVSGLHMKSFAHSTGEYSTWKNDEPRRQSFLSDLMGIIKTYADSSLATAVNMVDYRAVDKIYRLSEWAHPYAIAGAHCVAKIQKWGNKSNYDSSAIDFVFEDGDEGKGDLFQSASKHLAVNPIFKKKE